MCVLHIHIQHRQPVAHHPFSRSHLPRGKQAPNMGTCASNECPQDGLRTPPCAPSVTASPPPVHRKPASIAHHGPHRRTDAVRRRRQRGSDRRWGRRWGRNRSRSRSTTSNRRVTCVGISDIRVGVHGTRRSGSDPTAAVTLATVADAPAATASAACAVCAIFQPQTQAQGSQQCWLRWDPGSTAARTSTPWQWQQRQQWRQRWQRLTVKLAPHTKQQQWQRQQCSEWIRGACRYIKEQGQQRQ